MSVVLGTQAYDLAVLAFLTDAKTWLGENDLVVRIGATLLAIVAVLLVGRLATRAIRASARRAALHRKLDPWQTRALESRTRPLSILSHLAIYIAAALGILAIWRLQTAFLSVLTAAGFAGIIIGMAAANTLSNLIAGFIIFYNHPFDIGDWVEIDGTEGIILDVMPGATVMQTWNGEKVTFPNRLVEGNKVLNFSHQRKVRRRFKVSVDFSTDITKARELLLRIVKGHPDILQEPAAEVVGISFGESGIDLEVRYWVEPLRVRVFEIQTWFMQEVQRAFAKEGIVFPYPQRTLLWRRPGGEPSPDDTVSRMAYDPTADTRPIPAPPPAHPSPAARSGDGQAERHWWFGRSQAARLPGRRQ